MLEVYYKESVHVTTEAVKSKIFREGWQPAEQGKPML
jgi:hypothetical protein